MLNFDDYKSKIVAPPYKYVRRPSRPNIDASTLEEIKAYKDAVAEWDLRQEEQKSWAQKIKEDEARLYLVFKKEAEYQNDLDGMTRTQIDKVWAKAWSEGHSSGLSEIYNCFQELIEFYQDVRDA